MGTDQIEGKKKCPNYKSANFSQGARRNLISFIQQNPLMMYYRQYHSQDLRFQFTYILNSNRCALGQSFFRFFSIGQATTWKVKLELAWFFFIDFHFRTMYQYCLECSIAPFPIWKRQEKTQIPWVESKFDSIQFASNQLYPGKFIASLIYTMRTSLPKLLDLLIFCTYSLNHDFFSYKLD